MARRPGAPRRRATRTIGRRERRRPEAADRDPRPPSGRLPPGRACCRSGSHRPASSRSPTWPPPATCSARPSTAGSRCCWAIMFVILSVIYRPIEQLLSRTIADRRARGLHGHPLRVPALIQCGFALLFLIVALALRPQIEKRDVRRLERAVLDPGGRRDRLRARATSPAAGWPAISASRCTAGWCSWSRRRAFCSRWRWRWESSPARTASGSAWRWRRSPRCR